MGASLKTLLKSMRKQGLVAGKAIVIKARVPIIKCHLSLGVAADISLGAVNGAAAVDWVQRQVMRGVGRGNLEGREGGLRQSEVR